ncbi:DEAD-box ATP-dependent RNA helicase 14-like protein isoform X1 [Tanacetum coccineum]
MAADGTADALGVRYAPPDPTLPETWKGLIDGYTSVISYWNPETNVTQYERPTALVSLVPSYPPHVPSEPKHASLQAQPTGQQA